MGCVRWLAFENICTLKDEGGQDMGRELGTRKERKGREGHLCDARFLFELGVQVFVAGLEVGERKETARIGISVKQGTNSGAERRKETLT